MGKAGKKTFDVIVIGVGGMGSATCYQLAKRGAKVLGLEQFQLTHNRGSSHGDTRIIRRAYFEHSDYIPMLNRAYALWDELEQAAEKKFFEKCGLIIYGNPDTSTVYKGVLESASKYNIAIEEMDYQSCRERFPMFTPDEDMRGVFEADAGYLRLEESIMAHAALARRLGAEIRENSAVSTFKDNGSGVEVQVGDETFVAKKLVITGGPWSSSLLADLSLPLKIFRLMLYWFRSEPQRLKARSSPCFVFHTDDFVYGFPPDRNGLSKVASHFTKTQLNNPDELSVNQPSKEHFAEIVAAMNRYVPSLITSELVKFMPCIYTMTPDENFIIDQHPKYANVSFAAGFSGHGYKFAAVVGAILAELALEDNSAQLPEFLRLKRLEM